MANAKDFASDLGGFVPAGVMLPFAGAAAPSGWLLCDGAAVSQTTYAALYAAISTAWGNPGGGSFNLPDLRGRFPRGRDGGIARDPDRAGRTAANTGGNTGDAVGSVQGGQISSHDHSVYYGRASTAQDPPAGSYQGLIPVNVVWGPYGAVQGAGGNETRPINANVNYIIKY